MERKAYPSDVSDDEWALAAPYLTLMSEEAPQRRHRMREVFNGLRWLARSGAQWRMLPNDLPPWSAVYQQTQRWLKAGVFEAWLANDALKGPNGLLVQDGKLIVASFGQLPEQGTPELVGLLAVDLKDQSVSTIKNDPIGNLDGLQSLQPGIFLVTDWAAGALYRVGAKGKPERLLKLNKGSADLVYLADEKTVLVPIMLSNTLVAYKLD